MQLHIFAILLKQFSLKNVSSSGSGSAVGLTANDSFIHTKKDVILMIKVSRFIVREAEVVDERYM